MKIETKFEVGQKVFTIISGNIQEKVVEKIVIESGIKTYVGYRMGCGIHKGEADVFETKEDAVVGWLSQQNIDMLIIKGKI